LEAGFFCRSLSCCPPTTILYHSPYGAANFLSPFVGSLANIRFGFFQQIPPRAMEPVLLLPPCIRSGDWLPFLDFSPSLEASPDGTSFPNEVVFLGLYFFCLLGRVRHLLTPYQLVWPCSDPPFSRRRFEFYSLSNHYLSSSGGAAFITHSVFFEWRWTLDVVDFFCPRYRFPSRRTFF